MLHPVSVTLADVQKKLLTLFHSTTILIGHSLESDLRALKVSHGTVVDTALLYPHPAGPPVKHSLRGLVQRELGRFIQQPSARGHDSREDALGALHLAAHFVRSH